MADLFIDFETLSIDPTNCAVINFSWVVFNRGVFTKGAYSFQDLLDRTEQVKLNVKDQVQRFGYEVSADTLKFWKSQPDEVRVQALPSANDITVEAAVAVFSSSIASHANEGNKIERWWSRGNNFDPVILRRLFRDVGRNLDDVLNYSAMRDIRTYIDARFDFKIGAGETNFNLDGVVVKKHDSRHDIVADVLRMQKIEQTIE